MAVVTIAYHDGAIMDVLAWSTYDAAMRYATLEMAADVAEAAGRGLDPQLAESLNDVLDAYAGGASSERWEILYYEMRETAALALTAEVIVGVVTPVPEMTLAMTLVADTA